MIHLNDLLQATGGYLAGPVFAQHFPDFCYDSRRVQPGQLFLAVKTDKRDGHDYISQALEGGATGVICQSPPELQGRPVTCLVVPNTESALTDWARFVLRQGDLPAIGVTGSSGKTSTREAVAAVLARRWRVFRNPANYNGRFGLPIALGRLSPEHQVAVLEMAGDGFDQIAHLAQLTRPRVGIVTNVHHAYLAYFGSLKAIAQENGRLLEALPPASEGGLAILNHDDAHVHEMRARTRARVITYGFDPAAHLVASQPHCGPEGVTFSLSLKNLKRKIAPRGLPNPRSWPGFGNPGRAESNPLNLQGQVHVGLLGRHQVYTALAAIAVGLAHDIAWDDILAALAGLRPLTGRMNPLAGLNGSLILDDSYSANPASTLAALEALNDLAPAGARRIAVLGDMGQLGSYEREAHQQVGQAAAEKSDLLITVGERAELMAQAAQERLNSENIVITYSPAEAARYLRPRLSAGDVVLIKGDVEARLERAARALLDDPERDALRLPRAEAVWEQVRVGQPARPTWVEVNLDAIAQNARCVKALIGPETRLMAVLKADAYGHGAVKVARTVLQNGASYCGVASLNEALRLRQAGITAPVLVLGYTPAWQAREALLHDVTVTLYDLDVARAFSRAAVELQIETRAHVKVDSGMGRLGLLPDQALDFVRRARDLPRLTLEGIFTHFSVADEADLGYTREQLGRFERVLDELREAGVTFSLVHAANSAALLRLPASRLNMVRLGLALYGLAPSPSVSLPPGMQRALSWKTTVAQVKKLPTGSFVSYGNTYQTQGAETIAVIPVGYADGFRRAPRHWGQVLLRGQRAPIVGRVCMDQTMIRVDHIPGARVGDEVVLIGTQGGETITAEQAAERLGTINYEVVSEILARVPRVV